MKCHTMTVLIPPLFLGGVIKTVDLKVIFYYCPTKESILLPPPFSSFARDRQVGKLDFEQKQRYAQGRE